jgi:restriction system protein
VLISGSHFIHKIKKLSEENQAKLLDIALEGDYMTPTCPQCDVKMTLREGKKGKNPGQQFWGCVRYPRCKQTLTFKEQE